MGRPPEPIRTAIPSVEHPFRPTLRALAAAQQNPVYGVQQTVGAQSGTHRDVTLQVVDRARNIVADRFALLVYFAAVTNGAPQNAQTITVLSGSTVQTITANQTYLLLTGVDGKASVRVDTGGAATRYVEAMVLGRSSESDALVIV